jgi:hypothetical protein
VAGKQQQTSATSAPCTADGTKGYLILDEPTVREFSRISSTQLGENPFGFLRRGKGRSACFSSNSTLILPGSLADAFYIHGSRRDCRGTGPRLSSVARWCGATPDGLNFVCDCAGISQSDRLFASRSRTRKEVNAGAPLFFPDENSPEAADVPPFRWQLPSAKGSAVLQSPCHSSGFAGRFLVRSPYSLLHERLIDICWWSAARSPNRRWVAAVGQSPPFGNLRTSFEASHLNSHTWASAIRIRKKNIRLRPR